MTADVTITIASATNVLTVPAAALRGTDGDYRVLTMGADGTPVSTAVQVGLVTNTAAEIKSGLDEGTAVVIGTAAERTGTTTPTGGFGGAFPVGGGQIFRNGGGGNNRGNGGSVTELDAMSDADHLPRPGQPDLPDGPRRGARPR